MKRIVRVLTAVVLLGGTAAHAQQGAQSQGLADLSIQDLLNIEVTSVSRKAQELIDTAAAVYVITREDIRRSGATTLPDVLRLAPGFSVAELSANTWSVTARGFGGVHANKLLVLIDGRSVYTPLNGGVNWEMQLLALDAIEQIEVIRGPGGSLWGANAINGVINIITKSADRTMGGRFETHLGRYEPGNVALGYGGKFGETAHYVARARFFQRRVPGLTEGLANGNDLQAFNGRSRVDWGSGVNKFSWQADAEKGVDKQVQSDAILSPPYSILVRRPESFTEGSTMFSWKRTNSSRAESNLQLYYSGFQRSQLGEHSQTIDVDGRHHRAFGDRHDIVIGGEYRYTDSAVENGGTLSIMPLDADWNLVTAFAQDEIAVAQRVRLTAGAKVEHNQQTGVEVQPSMRALWTPAPHHAIWGAVSRAVRTPNRFERGMHIIASTAPGPGGLPLVVTLNGSDDVRAESLVEYETGYRVQHKDFSADVAGFYGHLRDLASLSRGIPGVGMELGSPVFRIPLTAANTGAAHSDGVEIATTFKPVPWWNQSTNYSFTQVGFAKGSEGAVSVPLNGPVPTHQFHTRSFVDLPKQMEASALFYGASALPSIGVDGLKRLDLQLSWAPSQTVRLSGGVRSLLHGASTEYTDNTADAVPTAVRPGPYAELRWWF